MERTCSLEIQFCTSLWNDIDGLARPRRSCRPKPVLFLGEYARSVVVCTGYRQIRWNDERALFFCAARVDGRGIDGCVDIGDRVDDKSCFLSMAEEEGQKRRVTRDVCRSLA